jgi:hypothetical protein
VEWPGQIPGQIIKTKRMRKPAISRTVLLLLVVALPAVELYAEDKTSTNGPAPLAPGQMPYLDAVNDPIEGFNR